MNKILSIYLICDMVLIALSLYIGGAWLLNTQVAFICSMLIVFGSFYSYKSMVEQKLHKGDFGDDRDLLDSIDDKHELFEESESKTEEISAQEFKKIYKEERARLGGTKRSFANLFKSWSGALGIFRILAYVVLFISILVLIRKGFFDPLAFIVGISVLPLATTILSYKQKA